MENDPLGNNDAYDSDVFDIDPETESAVDPEAAPLHTIYHNPLGGFTIPPTMLGNPYYSNHHFLRSHDSHLEHGRFPPTQRPGAEDMTHEEDHHAWFPILVAPTFGKGTGLEKIKGAREAMMISPVCGLPKLKEMLKHTFLECQHYKEGGNLSSEKGAWVLYTGVEAKEISVAGLGISMVLHEGNVEAMLTMAGRRAPEMLLNVNFIKTP
ncbi:hypothetical protein MMC18_003403 [Xylographa bjoerkii]|nr:hypothetical protein [Xylographa bjoerkii]